MPQRIDQTIASDDDIIKRLFLRDESALGNISSKYGKLLYGISVNIVGNGCDAEECVNDTMLRIWTSIPPEHPSNLKAYCSRIIRNVSINRAEFNSAEKRGGNSVVEELTEAIPDHDGDETSYSELTAAIDRFLRELPRDERITFVKRYWYSEPLSRIADELGCREEKIKSRLFRTRQKLKDYLEKEGISI